MSKAAAESMNLFHGSCGTGKGFMTRTGADSGCESTSGPNSGLAAKTMTRS